MEITGKIIEITREETIGTDLRKRTVHIKEVEGDYPNEMVLDFLGERVEKLNGLKEGDIVTIKFNSRVREYNSRKFNSISGRYIQKKSGENKSEEGEDLF